MITLLSPAKKLLQINQPYVDVTTDPQLIADANQLAEIMKKCSVSQIASLMDLSQDLAQLNFERYQSFYQSDCPISASYPAVFFFQGDVYQGLQAQHWNAESLEFAQDHLRILSGLYGLLRPKDKIQAYRLEMGTRLSNPRGETLYDFWREKLTTLLSSQLEAQKNPVLVNLASVEYAKVINQRALKFPIVTVHFYEEKNGQRKVVGLFAKKARGAMASFIVENQLDELDALSSFTGLNYHYCAATSTAENLNFVRMA